MSRYKILFSPSALIDVKEAALWYNSQQQGLGKRFKEDIKQVITSIILNPFFASIKYENVRTASCKHFPYSIHFEIDEPAKTVRIAAIFHFNREPFWLKKDSGTT